MFDRAANPRHLTDQELIRLQDGELKPKQSARAHSHLERCWECRWRANRKYEAVTRLMDYCERLAETLGPPPNQWSRFRLRLPSAEASPTGDALKSGSLRLSLKLNRLARVAFNARILTTTVSFAAVLWWCLSGQGPARRATGVLRQARLCEVRSLTIPGQLAIEQRMEISSGNKHAKWKIWQSPSHEQLQRTASGDISAAHDIDEIYRRNGEDPDHPLSAAIFQSWSKRPNNHVTEVRDDSGLGLISIRVKRRGTVMPGVIREAVLMIRKTDFHTSGEFLNVATDYGERQVQVREISYAIVPYAQTPLFHRASAPSEPVKAKVGVLSPRIDRRWSEIELQQAEADLRFILHHLGADISPVPEIYREGNHLVLQLYVDNEETKKRMRRALSRLPQVWALIWAPQDPVRQAIVHHPELETTPVILQRLSPLRLRQLEDCLGSPEKAGTYIDTVHTKIGAALVPALAFERLAIRYADGKYMQVPQEGRQELDEIASDYLNEFRRQWIGLRLLLRPQMKACSMDVPGGPSFAEQNTTTWRDDGLLLAKQLKQLSSAFDSLFVTQEIASPNPVNTQEESSPLAEMLALSDQIDHQASQEFPPGQATKHITR